MGVNRRLVSNRSSSRFCNWSGSPTSSSEDTDLIVTNMNSAYCTEQASIVKAVLKPRMQRPLTTRQLEYAQATMEEFKRRLTGSSNKTIDGTHVDFNQTLNLEEPSMSGECLRCQRFQLKIHLCVTQFWSSSCVQLESGYDGYHLLGGFCKAAWRCSFLQL